MRNTVLISIFILLVAGCNKDKFTTAPQLKYKSVNTTVLNRNEDLIFTLSFTDAEGDLTDSIFIIKYVPGCSASGISAQYRLPEFPTGKNQKGDITITFNYNDIPPKCFPKNDTCVFKFVLRDQAQHVSDTATSQTIIITE